MLERLLDWTRVQSDKEFGVVCMTSWLEKQIGWLLAIVAVIWGGYYLASAGESRIAYLRLGPLQLLLAGILLWLHGKYRRQSLSRTQ